MQVGQTLWYVPSRLYRGSPREVVVTKIGRQWGYIDGLPSSSRFDLRTLKLDGTTGSLYLNREVYEKQVTLNAAWTELRKAIDRCCSAPDGVTINQIENAMRSLFKRDGQQKSEHLSTKGE